MLLLDQENNATNKIRQIVVVSRREELRSQLAQLLRIRGFENVKVVDADFIGGDNVVVSPEDTVGVIVDIEEEGNLKTISQRVYSIIPQNVWCFVIGESDSISLAQNLLNEGILYFHSDSQLSQMVEKIISGVNIPLIRHTAKITVLGCKGGIGASLVSAHIANEIVLTRGVSVLLAQGSNGSQDLDLLFDKKLQADVAEYQPHLDIFGGDPASLGDEITNKYNFIVYDQPIFNVHKEKFSPFLEYSNTFILVVERRISSLRVAKQFLDECERVRNTSGKPIRIFVCISDNKLETSNLMAKADIETLLKCPVDAIIPFLKQTEARTVLSVNLGSTGKKEINSLVMKIIGVVSRNSKKNDNGGLFSSIYRSLAKK